MSDRWTDRISEYLDGDLDEATARDFERALETDAELAATLEEVRQLVDRAHDLPRHEAPPELWSKIEAQITGTPHAPIVDLAIEREKRGWLPGLASLRAIAAVVALVSIAALSGWWIGQRNNEAPTSAPQQLAAEQPTAEDDDIRIVRYDRASAVTPLEYSGDNDGLSDSILELERLLVEHGGDLDPETRSLVVDNLEVIDQAIREAREALAGDPRSDYLQTHLTQSMKQKVRLLQNATRLASQES